LLLAVVRTLFLLQQGGSGVSIPILMFVLYLVVMDPCFVTSDIATQKDITILVIAVQRAIADVWTVMCMLFCELFWSSPCTDFMKVKSVVHD
jgi:hypothetical protein